jgi:tetratricopeptide (TPR) repeat protein
LALTGRGLLRFIGGSIPSAEEDLREAHDIFRRYDDTFGTAFALSFYAETARLTGQVDEARARRRQVLDSYSVDVDDVFVVGVRAYSEAILATLDDDLLAAEAHYRRAADGFRRSDRPMMLAITLGFLADLDERHGHHRAAVEELDEAIALAEYVGMRGFVGSLYSRLAWSLLGEGDVTRAELMVQQALDAGRRLQSSHILFLAHAGAALVHRVHGRNAEAATAAHAAVLIHEKEGPDRFRNRIDPDFEIASVLAVCKTVLGLIEVEAGEPGRGARLLAEADRLRLEVGAPVPEFQVSDLERARDAVALAE